MATTTASNRREHARRQPTQGTICRLQAGANAKLGLVWNLSHGGVSLLVNEPIEPGTALSGELTTMTSSPSLPVQFHVMHLSKLLTGDYCIGAKFDKALTDDEVKPFLAK